MCLDILPDPILRNLLKFLSWNDILRLRRVCRATKLTADSFMKVNLKRAPEIEINERTERTLDSFITLEVGTTKLFLNNPDGFLFYEEIDGDALQQFFDAHKSNIKHLRVVQLSLWPIGREREFLNSFEKLESFEAHHFGWGKNNLSPEEVNHVMKMDKWHLFQNAFPDSLKNLQSIRICQDSNNELLNKIKLTAEIFIHSPKLKRACLPFTWNSILPPRTGDVDIRGTFMGEFSFLRTYINPRPNRVHTELGRLEFYDFINCHDDIGGWNLRKSMETLQAHWFGSLEFLELCDKALNTGLKLQNVSSFWLYARYARNGLYSAAKFGNPIVSLIHVHPNIWTLDMPNLEKITIPHSSGSIGIPRDQPRPNWPALRVIDITVDDSTGFLMEQRNCNHIPFTKQRLLINYTGCFLKMLHVSI